VTHTRVGKVKVNFASLKKILVSRLFKFKKNFNSDYIEVAKKISYYLIMELLLDNGANIHARDNSKRIPIYYIRILRQVVQSSSQAYFLLL
jgi:hypothetical protein